MQSVAVSSFKLMCIVLVLWLNWEIFTPTVNNPFKYLIMIQHPAGKNEAGEQLYRKGYGVSELPTVNPGHGLIGVDIII